MLPEYRNAGLGRWMLARLESIFRADYFNKMEMGAQCHAAPFYEKCGYSVVSGVFIDAGIEHVKMEKAL